MLRESLMKAANLPRIVQRLKAGEKFQILGDDDEPRLQNIFQFVESENGRYVLNMFFSNNQNKYFKGENMFISVAYTSFNLSGQFLEIQSFSQVTGSTKKEELDLIHEISFMEGGIL